jgi:PAS domain S-box-containing protein
MALATVIDPTSSVLSLLSRLAWAETVHVDGYLADLTEQLVRLLEVDVVLVGAIDNTRKSCRSIAAYSAARGKLNPFEQELLGSVVAEVTANQSLSISTGAEQRFVLDWFLREHRIEAYFGLPLLGASGDRIGVLSIYRSSELTLEAGVVTRLEVIAQRASAVLGLILGGRHGGGHSLIVEAHRVDGTRLGSDPPPASRVIVDDLDERSTTNTKTTLDDLRYRHYFELGAMGMAFVSLNGEFLDVNECLCSMLKRSRRKLIGSKWTDLCFPEDLTAERRLLVEITEGKSDGFTSDSRFHLPDQSVLPVGLAIRCVRRFDGRVDYLTLLVQDLTPRRSIEAQLMHSQRLEAVGKLAGGIAHDFNNLLTAILAHTDGIIPNSDPSVNEMVDGVRAAAIRAANLTSQLLAFARRQVIEPKVLDLNHSVSNTTEMLRRIVGEDIEVVVGSKEELWKVRVDPGQVEQVLVNLAVNARDAMPTGGRLLLATENLPRDAVSGSLGKDVSVTDYVAIIVADTGVGMNDDTLSHLFEPFYTTKGEGKGSGLGLATCHGIVSQNGGQIRVQSSLNVGTTFRIYWPRYFSDTVTAPSIPPSSPLQPNRETILLVEDDDMVRRVAVRVLRSKGFNVISAVSGLDALDVSSRYEGPIDLLLTDLVMPKMGGEKLAKELGPRRPEMRILFTSGYAEAAHDQGLGFGAHFLQKPYSPRQLVERIRKILDR